MKDNQIIKPVISDDCKTVTFEVRGHAPLTLDLTKLHPDVLARAAAVGMAQVRIVDAAAIGAADAEGNIIPREERTAMKRNAMERLIEHYETGTPEWALRRAEGGAREEGGITLRAVAAVQGVDAPTMRKRLEELAERRGTTTKALLRSLAGQEAVARKIAEMRAAKADGGLADELMAELG